MNKKLPAACIAEIEPVVEQVVSLKAAAAFYVKLSDIRIRASRAAESQKETFALAAAAQGYLNQADIYSREASSLLAKARETTRRYEVSLPGVIGLKQISDNYTARIAGRR